MSDDLPLHWEGTMAERAWHLLQDLLASYSDPHQSYHTAVVDKILSTDPDMKIPSWLTKLCGVSFWGAQMSHLTRQRIQKDIFELAFNINHGIKRFPLFLLICISNILPFLDPLFRSMVVAGSHIP